MHTSDPLLGTVIDGWHLQGHLGRGTMGQLYRAVKGGSVAALKVLHSVHARDEELRERFAREFANTAAIQHDNVVGSMGVGRTEHNLPFLVLEFLEGRTLDELIADEAPISTQRAVYLGAQIADGLAAAHAVKVVHRDLKPENIMRMPNDRIKLFDFGLARATVPNQPALTAIEARLGTPLFMAPEYIAKAQLDHRADLYALGMVLFELTTGTAPFSGPPFKIMHQQVNTEAPRASSAHPGISPLLDQLIADLLERDPAARLQSAEQASRLLRSITL